MKKVISVIISIALILSFSSFAYADECGKNNTRASNYLSSYSISLTPTTNHQLVISVDVEAKRQMTSIGVFEMYIEEYNETLGAWDEYDVWYGTSNPSIYYEYNSWDYVGTFYFTGTPGKDYRVTFTCFAMDSTGGDTGSVISVTRTCV